jgi:hypothetical protein
LPTIQRMPNTISSCHICHHNTANACPPQEHS